jgi:hypothetical protein
MKYFADPSFLNLSRVERFGQCYRLLVGPTSGFSVTDIDRILTKSLQHMHYTDADICLAELVRSGVFDVVLTCAVDNTLEQALEYVGLRELHEFDVFSLYPGIAKEKLLVGNNVHCHIIKVFGELTSRDYTIRRAGYITRNQEIRQHLESFAGKDLMIIGLDPVWDAEIYHLFPLKGGSFWFINEEQLDKDSSLFHAGEARNAVYLWGDTYGYRQFLPYLHEQYFNVSPEELLINNWAGNVSIFRQLHRLTYEVRKLREEVQSHHEASESDDNPKYD